jgi:hypothetical protein
MYFQIICTDVSRLATDRKRLATDRKHKTTRPRFYCRWKKYEKLGEHDVFGNEIKEQRKEENIIFATVYKYVELL